MFRPAAPALLVRSAARLVAAAKVVASVAGCWRPSDAAALNDRMLRDIGLERYDVWDAAAEAQFRTMADVPMRPGRDRDRGSRHR